MTTTCFSVDDHDIDIEWLSKANLEILFKLCGLRGDTARILKADLVGRIAYCDERTVSDCLAQMMDDCIIFFDSAKHGGAPRPKPKQEHPLTAMVRKSDAVEVDVPVGGLVFRISIKQIS